MPVYLDCAATTPLDPRVIEVCLRYMRDDFGNAHSRTHDFGAAARRAVERARDQVAAVAGANRGDVIFTSGATESNNLVLLGLETAARATGRNHIVSTAIEHQAILEPLRELERRGLAVTLIAPGPDGAIAAEAAREALRPETLLVSVMHINNETGAIQPLDAICDALNGHDALLHTDAAQGFAKQLNPLRNPRIDFISVSSHKICGPKGIGALIARKRSRDRAALSPLLFGGGQERGLRPGTLPVPQIAGFGLAAQLWAGESQRHWRNAENFRDQLLTALAPLHPAINGATHASSPFILNLSFPGWDADSVMEAWAGIAAVSDGAACSSQSYTCSHVLAAMQIPPDQAAGAIRMSWCPLTPMPDTAAMVAALREVAVR
ncbi:MAG: aminotransferase class V-fold PLP-dependent enzyme [Acidobacteria bacterium]|nr:aminotransferase class V-fold PLP-dependent enzyme [Acidobacteriota bacterium]